MVNYRLLILILFMTFSFFANTKAEYKNIFYDFKINSINDFSFKTKIKGKIGTFSIKDKKVLQELDIYKTEKNNFTKF